MNISQTKRLKPLSVHEHTHQLQTYFWRKKDSCTGTFKLWDTLTIWHPDNKTSWHYNTLTLFNIYMGTPCDRLKQKQKLYDIFSLTTFVYTRFVEYHLRINFPSFDKCGLLRFGCEGILKIGRKRVSDWMNQRICCRTAPATRGLLNIIKTSFFPKMEAY